MLKTVKRLKVIAGVSYAISVILCISMIGVVLFTKKGYISTVLMILCGVFTVLTVLIQMQISKYNIDKLIKDSGDNIK